ncbi:MAG: chemotaxis protein CheD [Ignavibacteriales bacterium]
MKVVPKIHINIGELYASKRPVIMHTTLGSCVAVCFYDYIHRIGGMNHIMLPEMADFNVFNDSARYGINAMELLINEILKLGGERENLIAKVFGGAHVLPDFSIADSIGRRNISFVKQFLETEGIRIISQHTGGTFTRIVYFHTGTSNVLMKKLHSSFFRTMEEENRFLQQYKTEIIKPDTTIF